MSDLKTLRGLSGLSPEPARLTGSALLMIDLQNTYRESVMRLANVEPAIAEAKALLVRAREAGSLIIHVRHDAGAGSPYDLTAPIGQISDEVAPQGDEAVVTKAAPSAMSAHLAILSRAGLVSSTKVGRSVVYRATPKSIDELIVFLAGARGQLESSR